MTEELRARLQERLHARSERLTKMAAIKAPLPVLALMAEHVTATAMLLFGDEMAKRLFDRVLTSLRDGHGICICGEAFIAAEQPLCAACMKEMDDLDAELDGYDPAMFEEQAALAALPEDQQDDEKHDDQGGHVPHGGRSDLASLPSDRARSKQEWVKRVDGDCGNKESCPVCGFTWGKHSDDLCPTEFGTSRARK